MDIRAFLRRRAVVAALVAAAAIAVYSNSLRNGFVLDDRIYIEGNPLLRDAANIRYLLSPRLYAGAHGILAPSRPVFLASLFADRAMWGFDPAGYHLTNVLLHAADSVWVCALARALAPGTSGLLAGLLFALHPLQSEAVDGICFRADLLAAFFAFAALWCYLRSRRTEADARRLLPASAALFGLGLLSKEMAASLPVLVVLVEAYFPAPRFRAKRVAWAMALYAAVALLFVAFWAPRFRYSGLGETPALRAAADRFSAAMPSVPGAGAGDFGVERGRLFPPSSSQWEPLYRDRGVRFWTMTRAFAGYFGLMLCPSTLVVSRAPVLVHSGMEAGALACAAFLALLLLYAAAMRRKHPVSAFGVAWCFAALAPVSGVLPLFNPVAERYLYFVMAGAAWALASAFESTEKPPLRGALAALAAAVLLAYGAGTFVRNRDWSSERSLFLTSQPDAAQNVGAYLIRGDILGRDGRWEDAVREYDEATRLDPRGVAAWLGLGKAYAGLGDRTMASSSFGRAVSLAPENPVVHFAFGSFLSRSGDVRGAMERYRKAVALEPGYLEAWVNLGALYRDARRVREAKSCYEKALSLSPRDPTPYYSFALLLEKAEPRRAEALYREALKKDSAFCPARLRLGRLCYRTGRKAEALALSGACGQAD